MKAQDSFLSSVQDCQKKAHLVPQVRRFGIQIRCLPVNRQCACGVALSLQRRTAGLQILDGVGRVTDRTERQEHNWNSHLTRRQLRRGRG